MATRSKGMRELRAALKGMPLELASQVADRGAPALTTITRATFASGQTVYGNQRPAAVGGGQLSLVKSGTTAAQLRFVASGRVIKCVIGPDYAKYLIGKYKILPNGGLPASFVRKLSDVVTEVKL